MLLGVLLDRAVTELDILRPTPSTSGFLDSMQEQMVQSGLLQQLPALLASAASEVEARLHVAAVCNGGPAAAKRDTTNSRSAGGSTSSATSNSSNSTGDNADSSSSSEAALQQYVCGLLHTYQLLHTLLREDPVCGKPALAVLLRSSAARSAAPLSCLLVAAMQYAGRQMQPLQQRLSQPLLVRVVATADLELMNRMQTMLGVATAAMTVHAETVNLNSHSALAGQLARQAAVYGSSSNSEPLVFSQHYIPALALAMLAVAFGLTHKLSLTASDRRMAEGATAGNTAFLLETWDVAGQQQGRLTCCQQQLFDVLGVDSRVVLWAAVCAAREEGALRNNDLAMLGELYFKAVTPLHDADTGQLLRQQHSSSQGSSQGSS